MIALLFHLRQNGADNALWYLLAIGVMTSVFSAIWEGVFLISLVRIGLAFALVAMIAWIIFAGATIPAVVAIGILLIFLNIIKS